MSGLGCPRVGGFARVFNNIALNSDLRLFDVLRGTEHVLVAHLGEEGASVKIADLAAWKRELGHDLSVS